MQCVAMAVVTGWCVVTVYAVGCVDLLVIWLSAVVV